MSVPTALVWACRSGVIVIALLFCKWRGTYTGDITCAVVLSRSPWVIWMRICACLLASPGLPDCKRSFWFT